MLYILSFILAVAFVPLLSWLVKRRKTGRPLIFIEAVIWLYFIWFTFVIVWVLNLPLWIASISVVIVVGLIYYVR